MWDWSTAASLATALGTLVLALATFVAVRAANRAARTAEYSMQIGIRPLLMPSRLTDTEQKIMWGDEHWARLSGSGAIAEVVDDNLYLAMSVRNSGSGVAVIHGWHLVLQELQRGSRARRARRVPPAAARPLRRRRRRRILAGRDPRSRRSRVRRPARGRPGAPRLRDRAALQRPRGRSARDRTVRGGAGQGVGVALLRGPALEPGPSRPPLIGHRGTAQPSVIELTAAGAGGIDA